MEVDFAFLCDYAENPGKLYALGIGFDTLYAQSLPYIHPIFFAVLRLRFSIVEVGDKALGVRVIDADGNHIIPPLDTTIRVEPPPPGLTERTITIALAFHGVKFERYGSYAVIWLLQGNEVKRTPFRVIQPPTTV